MRRLMFLLTIIFICAGCVSQNSTSLPTAPVGITSTPIQVIKTTLPAESPTTLPIIEEPEELPGYFDMSCFYVPEFTKEKSPQGWSRYINAEYCFSFIYPSDWALVASQHFVALSKEPLSLMIGVRKNRENVEIQRTGVGAGEIETVGKIYFLGQEISKELLVYEGKTKEVIYQYGTEFFADDLVFTISGGNYATNYDLATLEDEEIDIFDQIVNSFQRIRPKKLE